MVEIADATEFVNTWEKHWLREGRLEGQLDKRAKEDLIARVAGLMARKAEPKAKKAKAE